MNITKNLVFLQHSVPVDSEKTTTLKWEKLRTMSTEAISSVAYMGQGLLKIHILSLIP